MKKLTRTYIQGDEELVCSCNYFPDSLIFDLEKQVVYCSICRHQELLPSYCHLESKEEMIEHYTDPKKKVYDFGLWGVQL